MLCGEGQLVHVVLGQCTALNAFFFFFFFGSCNEHNDSFTLILSKKFNKARFTMKIITKKKYLHSVFKIVSYACHCLKLSGV